MVNSSATKSSRLLNPWALAVVAVAVGGLLWATFQREEVFQPDGREPDAVSANYAELLLTAHPDDDHLRLQLVDLLIRLGDYTKARQHVDAWPKPQPELQAYYRLELDALIAAGGNDLIVQQALVERLQSFDHRKLPVAQLESLAKLALTLQAPGFAATVFEEIAGRDPAQRTDALKSAAQWYLAGEQPARAADIYLQLKRDAQQPGERREYAQLAFNSLLSAGRDEQAAQVLADELPQLKNPQTDVAWLEQGVDVAVATKQFELAQRVLQQWHDLEPDNRNILVKESMYACLSMIWQVRGKPVRSWSSITRMTASCWSKWPSSVSGAAITKPRWTTGFTCSNSRKTRKSASTPGVSLACNSTLPVRSHCLQRSCSSVRSRTSNWMR